MLYRFDPSVRFVGAGRALLGGDPIRLMRMTDAGARRASEWRRGGVDIDDGTADQLRSVVDRFVDAGMLHPVAGRRDARSLDVAFVVPVRDRAGALDACLGALVAAGASDVVVVDDGSRDASAHRDVADRHGARLVCNERSAGPAAARMAGFAATTAAFVAFVDSDVEVDRDWLARLAGHFDDPRVGLVAPRVVHRGGDGVVDRYEEANSPLDLGVRPAPIVAGTRVSYVPAAAMVVRRDAFDAVLGFDVDLRVGEDVDLVWRLHDAGWRCRYEPASTVVHSGRPTARSMLRRRFDYGRSAAALDRRHAGRLAPVRASGSTYAVAGLLAAGRPLAALSLMGRSVRDLAGTLGLPGGGLTIAAQLVASGQAGLCRQLGRALVRPWFPVTLLVALAGRRFRRVAVVVPVLVALDARRRLHPRLDPVTWTAAWVADEVAYSTGVWAGCLSERTLGPLLPASDLAKTRTGSSIAARDS